MLGKQLTPYAKYAIICNERDDLIDLYVQYNTKNMAIDIHTNFSSIQWFRRDKPLKVLTKS